MFSLVLETPSWNGAVFQSCIGIGQQQYQSWVANFMGNDWNALIQIAFISIYIRYLAIASVTSSAPKCCKFFAL